MICWYKEAGADAYRPLRKGKGTMMIKIHKKGMAWLLMAGLVLGSLGGCQKKAGGTIEDTGKTKAQAGESGPGDGSTVLPSEEAKEPGAMGRYGETEIELPQEMENHMKCGFMKGESGSLELFTKEGDYYSDGISDAFHYVYQDGIWEKDENWAGNDALKEKGIDLMEAAYGQDGSYYLGGTDGDYRYHLFRLEEDGSLTECLEGVFDPTEGREYGLLPPKFQVLEDGSFLIYEYYEVYLYDASGKRLFSMAKDFSGTTSDARGFSEGGEFVTVLDNQIVRYDLKNGRITDTVSYDEIDGARDAAELFGDGQGGIYMATEVGLSHISKGGSMWEVLIDGSLNHMGMRSIYMTGFLEGESQDYYGLFAEEAGKGLLLFHYVYDPDMAAVPPSGLTVYSLKDHSTVRQAASQFQSEHPDVRVEVRTAVEDGGSVTEEMIQGLNTELLSGKGADILILDGLPADSYIEKGILMDLSGLVEELESSGEMYNNLLDGLKEEDGKIYQVPARFSFPLLLGEEKAIQAYSSLEAMKGYEGEKPLVPTENYGNLLRMTATLRYKELFGSREGLADRGLLIRYLETVKAIGEANGAKTVFSEEEMEEKWTSNYVKDDGIMDNSIQYDAGRADSSTEEADGYGTLCIAAEVRRLHPGTLMVPAEDLYRPFMLASVNHSTANEELAKEFIRCLLSYEVQKEELYDGFPVNKKAMAFITEKDKEGFSVGSGIGDYHISAEYPSREVREEIGAMADTLKVPVRIDWTVMQMVEEGARDYLDGKESVEQAADKILRTMSIYLAE